MNGDISPHISRQGLPSVTDVYTNLSGLSALKNESDDVALKKISQQFESMFISMLLKTMRSANDVFSKGNLSDSQESKFYRDMHDNQLALSLSHGKGFGLAESLYRQLSQANTIKRQIEVNPASPPASMKTSGGAGDVLAETPEDFVSLVHDSAKKVASKLGVDATVLVAQAALETGWGRHVVRDDKGVPSHNLFNIKADGRWAGNIVEKNTVEFLGGKMTRVNDRFRAYHSIEDSFQDYQAFILENDRYKDAVNPPSAVNYIERIHDSGYATDPNYVKKVTAVYHQVQELLKNADLKAVQR